MYVIRLKAKRFSQGLTIPSDGMLSITQGFPIRFQISNFLPLSYSITPIVTDFKTRTSGGHATSKLNYPLGHTSWVCQTWLERQITKVDFDSWKLGMGLYMWILKVFLIMESYFLTPLKSVHLSRWGLQQWTILKWRVGLITSSESLYKQGFTYQHKELERTMYLN